MKNFLMVSALLLVAFCWSGNMALAQTGGSGQTPANGYVPTPEPTAETPPAETPEPTTEVGGAPSTEVGSGGGTDFYSVKLQEPLDGKQATLTALNGVDLINKYLSMIYKWMAGIVGLIAVLMIAASGVQIIFGGASPELVSDAKTRILQALLSLVLLFATALILKTVNPTFFAYY